MSIKKAKPSPARKSRKSVRHSHSNLKLHPKILIFDIDGVLIDVRATYWRSAIETVRHLSGKHVTYAELHKWKAKPGHNDDWRMTANWVTALGKPTSYEEARAAFETFYWGTDNRPGNVHHEKFVITAKQIERWAKKYELHLFTGRTRREYAFTFDKWPHSKHFETVVTMDDVENGKPAPDGLLRILAGRDPSTAVYVGDNIDDALAARDAKVPFMAILPKGADGYRERLTNFRKLGAVGILNRASEVNSWLGT
ncbi:MAG: HAD-IA family hydrolase [Acidobacteria bacterium]|nr:HAD-IA family hydrolase [Acidobacteriota bacterium]